MKQNNEKTAFCPLFRQIPMKITVFAVKTKGKKCPTCKPMVAACTKHFFGKSEDGVEEVHGLGSPLHHHIGIDFSAVDVGVS